MVVLMALLLLTEASTEVSASLHPISTVLHVHSTWSTGDQTLDQLVTRGRAVGVEAIFLAENHLQRYEYGLPPLRGLLRYRVDYPSVLSNGPEAFLKAIQDVNTRQGEVLVIPGVEVVPHYFWTGSLLRGTLTMHNAQKNLLALGMYRAADYRELPAGGNHQATAWGLRTLWLLSPALLSIPATWLLRTRRRRIVQLQHFRVTEERRLILPGLLCMGVGALLLVNNFPYRAAPVSPYDSQAGLRPHQEAIDFVNARGGVAVWSLPEARDSQEVTVAGLRAAIRTDPYPADLLRTDRYTAFGGIYEDTVTFTKPGQGWDQLLLEYLHGRRKTPAWAVGEAAYHREGEAAKFFGNVQTVLLVDRKDPRALLDALRAGRMYALFRLPDDELILDQFQLVTGEHPPAEAGASLTLRPSARPEVHVSVRTQTGKRFPVEVRLIRSGILIHTVKGETPVSLRWTDAAPSPDSRAYYRLEVVGPDPHQILSNPIFVQTSREGQQ